MNARVLLLAAAVILCPAIAPPSRSDSPPAASAAAPTAAPSAAPTLADLKWQPGPMTAPLGDLARIEVPEGFVFLGAGDTRTFLELNENPTSGGELGIIIPAREGAEWFVVFEFNEVGYVKDEEKERLEADPLLKTLREGNDRGNEVRRERGWATLEILGWQTEPHYDARTNNLTWAILGESQGRRIVNHSTRLLGRKGYMTVDLVLQPDLVATALPEFDALMNGFSYGSGHRYAEFRSGDKIASYGLTALVAGGAAAAAVKSGFLAKFWKVLVAAGLGLAAILRKLAARIFGHNETVVQGPPQGPGAAT